MSIAICQFVAYISCITYLLLDKKSHITKTVLLAFSFEFIFFLFGKKSPSRFYNFRFASSAFLCPSSLFICFCDYVCLRFILQPFIVLCHHPAPVMVDAHQHTLFSSHQLFSSGTQSSAFKYIAIFGVLSVIFLAKKQTL